MFDYLKDLEVGVEKTAEFPLYGVPGFEGRTPVLIVRPATNSNKPLVNAVLKKSGKVRELASKGQDAEFLAATRDEDRELYSQHVLVGWRDIVNGDKATVPFNTESALELMRKLPVYMFDRLRSFAGQPESFLQTGESLDPNLAGN